MVESQRVSDVGEFLEFGRCIESHDREVTVRGAEVLADREDVDIGAAERSHRLEEFVPLLAESDDNPRLG
jgi:hypothetical protein